jgi:drug/metabolite transporter (DMT)-like permease
MSSASDNLRGIALMILAAGVLLLNDAVSKLLAERYALSQVICLRHIAALLPILLYVQFRAQAGWGELTIVDRKGQLIRGICFIGSVWLMIWSVNLLPLPTVTAIAFASPLFIAALAVPMLGETVGWRRWAATLAGFLGVLVIVRPGTAAFEWALLVPVAAAFVNGTRDVLTRRLARTDTSLSILFWSSMIVIATTLPFALAGGWKAVTWPDAWLFLLAGLLNTGAHFLIVEALRLGQASVISPYRYSALLWSIMVGYLIWGDLPTLWTLLGALILIASGVYMIRHRG